MFLRAKLLYRKYRLQFKSIFSTERSTEQVLLRLFRIVVVEGPIGPSTFHHLYIYIYRGVQNILLINSPKAVSKTLSDLAAKAQESLALDIKCM